MCEHIEFPSCERIVHSHAVGLKTRTSSIFFLVKPHFFTLIHSLFFRFFLYFFSLLAQIQRWTIACLAQTQVVKYSDLKRTAETTRDHIVQRCRNLPKLRWITGKDVWKCYQHDTYNSYRHVRCQWEYDIVTTLKTCPKLYGFISMTLPTSLVCEHASLFSNKLWLDIYLDDKCQLKELSLPNVNYMSLSIREHVNPKTQYRTPELKYLFFSGHTRCFSFMSIQNVRHLCWKPKPPFFETDIPFERALSSFPSLRSCELIIRLDPIFHPAQERNLFSPHRLHIWDFLKTAKKKYTLTLTLLSSPKTNFEGLIFPCDCVTRIIHHKHLYPHDRFVESVRAEICKTLS